MHCGFPDTIQSSGIEGCPGPGDPFSLAIMWGLDVTERDGHGCFVSSPLWLTGRGQNKRK